MSVIKNWFFIEKSRKKLTEQWLRTNCLLLLCACWSRKVCLKINRVFSITSIDCLLFIVGSCIVLRILNNLSGRLHYSILMTKALRNSEKSNINPPKFSKKFEDNFQETLKGKDPSKKTSKMKHNLPSRNVKNLNVWIIKNII